jgi:hypothetical protein
MTPAIVRRPTAIDSMCDRCYEDIPEGEIAGYVEPGLHRIPWVAGTVLCSRCSDHLAYKAEQQTLRVEVNGRSVDFTAQKAAKELGVSEEWIVQRIQEGPR